MKRAGSSNFPRTSRFFRLRFPVRPDRPMLDLAQALGPSHKRTSEVEEPFRPYARVNMPRDLGRHRPELLRRPRLRQLRCATGDREARVQTARRVSTPNDRRDFRSEDWCRSRALQDGFGSSRGALPGDRCLRVLGGSDRMDRRTRARMPTLAWQLGVRHPVQPPAKPAFRGSTRPPHDPEWIAARAELRPLRPTLFRCVRGVHLQRGTRQASEAQWAQWKGAQNRWNEVGCTGSDKIGSDDPQALPRETRSEIHGLDRTSSTVESRRQHPDPDSSS